LADVKRVLLETTGGGRPFLWFYRLEKGVCPDQCSVDWIIAVLSGFQIREEVKLKAIDDKNLPKPVKMALRTRDKFFLVPEDVLQWIKSLNPWIHTQNWRVFDSNEDPTGGRLILIVDRESATAFKSTNYKIFTGFS
jgi:hypothetical protein